MKTTFTLVVTLLFALPLPAAVVWEFGAPGVTTVSFSADGSDSSDPGQQDIITPGVVITRDAFGGIFNVAVESSYAFFGPSGTEWAFAGLGPEGGENPVDVDFSASQFANLTFENWADALGRRGGRPTGNLLSNIVGTPGVVHLIDEDIYFDIVFTEWGASGAGNWGYERAVGPIPEPAALALLALAALPWLRRKR